MKRAFCFVILIGSAAVMWRFNAVIAPVAAAMQQPPHVEIKIDPKLFDSYVGQYVSAEDPDFIFSFLREGDKFYLAPTGQGRVEIFPESQTKFFLKIVEATATFLPDAQGKVTGVVWRQNGVDNSLKKISDQPVMEKMVAFEKREEMVRMRDGVRLHTLIFWPKDQSDNLPIIMSRTPYGIDTNSDGINRRYNEFIGDGYIFVLQDIRGRFGSEGEFVMNRPMRTKKDARSIDESTDTYDTIDWLIKNISKNNGRVGILGVSYDGWLSAVATIDAHPALKASSPQAPMTDTWLGDDFFHNGAFRQSYGYEYVKAMETSKEFTDVSIDKDAYDWYLGMGALGKITELAGGKFPTWNAFVAHPAYDEYWKARGSGNYLKATTVATLVVGGWWDQEDYYGALATYEALEKFDKKHQNFLVLGPWNHGGWDGRGRSLGSVNFGASTGIYFRSKIQAPWFAYYLKDKGEAKEPEAMTFQTGCNRWQSYDHWSPKEATAGNLYLRDGGTLAFDKPAGEAVATYVSDPANPVPYRKRPIEATYDSKGSGWYTWLVQDQRFLKDRKDVVSWQSEVLDHDMIIAGDVVAHLFASTSGTDSDWVVKLIDVYPEDSDEKKMAGFQLMVADEIFRGRYRKSFQQPEPITAGEVNEYTIDLHSANHCFRKGHRVMVQVQSSWFPLYDRNPQKFVENIFKAGASDYQVATQKIYESARYPSRVTLPVIQR